MSAVAACDGLTFSDLIGEARYGAGTSLRLKPRSAVDYPTTAGSPVIAVARPDGTDL